jgi:hypothetical protein
MAWSLTGFALPVVTPVCRKSCSLLPDLAVCVHVSSVKGFLGAVCAALQGARP